MARLREILGMNKKESAEKVQYQNLQIKFTSGKEVIASVPAFCFDEEEAENLEIDKILITEPRDLPKGHSFA